MVGKIIKLKLRKRIATLMLAMAVGSTLIIGNVASADAIVSKGIKVYSGVFTDDAFAWTGSNISGNVTASVVRTSNWSNVITGIDSDGWVQTRQTTYVSTSVIGMHASESDSGRSYP